MSARSLVELAIDNKFRDPAGSVTMPAELVYAARQLLDEVDLDFSVEFQDHLATIYFYDMDELKLAKKILSGYLPLQGSN